MASQEDNRQLIDALALVDAEEFDAGASKLRVLLPNLDGRELLDALIALGAPRYGQSTPRRPSPAPSGRSSSRTRMVIWRCAVLRSPS